MAHKECDHLIGQVTYIGMMKPRPIFKSYPKALYENGHRDIISKINFTECSLCGVKLNEKGLW